MSSDDRAPRVGRPRHAPGADTDLNPREQILDAAAALFVENGFSATSTRAIAERVGIRQASLYYHFAGKDDMLAELLTTSVQPSLEIAHSLEEFTGGGSAGDVDALYALVVSDVETLVRSPHNIGMLYLLPEVQGERYAAFRAERAELARSYGRLGHAAATAEVAAAIPAERLGRLLIQITETVIELRRTGHLDDADKDAIAATCLRACGLGGDAIAEARRGSAALLLETLPRS
jgi:AcrR family transcriptional regulator